MHILRKIISCLLFALGTSSAFGYSFPKHEIRAVWITTLDGLDWPTAQATGKKGIEKQKQELCHILDRLKQANFNTVLLQTRIRGDVIYPSLYEPYTASLTGETGKNPGYDPLRFAIEECHKRGMELHAWIVTIPVGSVQQIKSRGTKSVVRKKPSICKLYQNAWYLDPGNPQTDDYLAGIVREIVSQYDVDGINFDYIRYPEQAEKFPDKDTYAQYGRGKNKHQWRRDNITRIVQRLHNEIKSVKPWVKVSSSPIGKYNDTNRYSSHGWNAYKTVYQDAQQWLEMGIHDVLFPMMYFQDNQFYPFVLDWKENDNGKWIVPGLGIYFLNHKTANWTINDIVRQLYFLRNIQADGQAYFRSCFLLDNTQGIFDELQSYFYLIPAVVPPMTWTDSIAPATPTEPVFTSLERGVHLQWKASSDNLSPVYYRIYASDAYPVNIDNPANLIHARIEDTQYTFLPEFPWQEPFYWAVTAVDRCGNESLPLEMNHPLFLK